MFWVSVTGKGFKRHVSPSRGPFVVGLEHERSDEGRLQRRLGNRDGKGRRTRVLGLRLGAGQVAAFSERDAPGLSLSHVMNGHPKGLAREDGGRVPGSAMKRSRSSSSRSAAFTTWRVVRDNMAMVRVAVPSSRITAARSAGQFAPAGVCRCAAASAWRLCMMWRTSDVTPYAGRWLNRCSHSGLARAKVDLPFPTGLTARPGAIRGSGQDASRALRSRARARTRWPRSGRQC